MTRTIHCRGDAERLRHLTLALQPLTLADLPGQVLSMAWKAPGEFGFKRRASSDTPSKVEDRVRHHRDHVWPTRERFVNQILNGVLLAAPPAALATVATELNVAQGLQAPALNKLSTRKLGRFVGEPDFVLFDPGTRGIVLGEIKIGASPGNDRYCFEQYTKYMLLGALLRAAGLADNIAHVVVVPDSDPKVFCKDYKRWRPAVDGGRLKVSPEHVPMVRRRDTVIYHDHISWADHAEQFLTQPRIQLANNHSVQAVADLRLQDRAPALWPTTIVTWAQLAQTLDVACVQTGAGHLRAAIQRLDATASDS